MKYLYVLLMSNVCLQQTELAPVVSFALRNGFGNTPSCGGLTATLSGMAFGLTDFTPTGTIASVDCATSSWASGTTVECLTSSATQAGGFQTPSLAVVTMAFLEGTGLSLFSFDGTACPPPPVRSHNLLYGSDRALAVLF